MMKQGNYNYDKYIGFRYSMTGVFGYVYYTLDKQKICTVSGVVVPSAPILIRSGNICLKREFQKGGFGSSGKWFIANENTGETVATISRENDEEYVINDSIKVLVSKNGYSFYAGSERIAMIRGNKGYAPFFPEDILPYYDDCYEPYYDVDVISGSVDPILKMLIFAFPCE